MNSLIEPVEQETLPPVACANPGRSRAFLLVGVCVASFFLTMAFVRFRLSMQAVPDIQEKIAFFANHGEEFDTVFVGSSRIFHQIVPKLFDRLMAEAGFPTHSYNLGMSAMSAPEDSFLMDAAFAKRRRPLKFVLVETSDKIRTDYSCEGMDNTLRVEYWHDFKRLAVLTRTIVAQRKPAEGASRWMFSERERTLFLYHLRLFVANSLNIGRGVGWLQSERDLMAMTFRRHPPRSAGRSRKFDDGFGVIDPPIEIDDHQWSLLQGYIKRPVARDFGDTESQREVQDKRRLVEFYGGRMFAVLPPISGGTMFSPDPQFGAPIPVLDCGDPNRYPELFERQNRQDSGHLNYQGAEIFTRRIVEQLVKSLRSKFN